jgi:hypothetical protein
MDRAGPEKPPEKRKVGGSTPPLTTQCDQPNAPADYSDKGVDSNGDSSLMEASAIQRGPEPPECLPLLFQRHVGVDRHRDLDGRVTDDLPDHMCRGAEV